jgi:hypothetical protein
MSDTANNQDAMLSTAKSRAARTPRPGALASCLRHLDGRVQSCELRNDVDFGSGVDRIEASRA